MSKIDDKILKLEQQRSALDQQLKDLKVQRNEDILNVLNSFPDGGVPSKTIIGILLEGMDTATKDSQKAEVWHQAGEKFCKRRGSKKRTKKTATSVPKAAQNKPENSQQQNATGRA